MFSKSISAKIQFRKPADGSFSVYNPVTYLSIGHCRHKSLSFASRFISIMTNHHLPLQGHYNLVCNCIPLTTTLYILVTTLLTAATPHEADSARFPVHQACVITSLPLYLVYLLSRSERGNDKSICVEVRNRSYFRT